jgi:hypothetical protein
VNFINNKNDYSKNKNILLNNLAHVYNFQIENFKKRQAIWELCVLDSLTLKKHQSSISTKSDYTATAKIYSDSLIFINSDLGIVAKNLTSKYGKFIINKSNIQGIFNLKLAFEDFKAFEKTLNTKYGLTLKKKEKELEYTYVHFLKD